MNNYLIYVCSNADSQPPAELTILDQMEMMEEYAKLQRWNVVGTVAEKRMPSKTEGETRIDILRRYLERHIDINVVAIVSTWRLPREEISMLKDFLRSMKVKLIDITIAEEKDD